MAKKRLPTTLLEAVGYFSDLDVATEYVARLRWPDGPVCPRCAGTEYSYLKTRRLWKCKACKKQYSVKVGTIFEDSPLGLDKWLPAVWLAANSKNGISSHELGRALGITQKSAWFILHRIRLAMQDRTFEMLSGEVEVDETYIGGKARNMHHGGAHIPRDSKIGRGRGTANKTAVLGMVERVVAPFARRSLGTSSGGRFTATSTTPLSRARRSTRISCRSYAGLGRDFNHLTINDAVQ